MEISEIKILISSMIRNIRIFRNMDTSTGIENHKAAELSRFTHSIEKGLTISNPRLGFGHDKQKKMMDLIGELRNSSSPYHKEVCCVAMDALESYLLFHRERNYYDDVCLEIEKFIQQNYLQHEGCLGGVIKLRKKDLDFDIEAIEYFFNSRHSIRDFSSTPVDEELLWKALRLAQRAPSACNRQGVRAYVLSETVTKDMAIGLSGIGGFADAVGRFILITGKLSAYRKEENSQYIVSASMYAAYLSMTLHLYGLGACVVQRQVVWSREWEQMQKKLNIPEDEQMILLLAVGNMPEECLVPISHRLQNDEMIQMR